jgi:hypothetical protein
MKKKTNRSWPAWVNILIAVLAIIAVFVTWGIITQKKKQEELAAAEEEQASLNEIRIEQELKQLQKEFSELEKRISELTPLIKKIEKRMKLVLLLARIGIGTLLVAANISFFLSTAHQPYNWENIFSSQLNLNEAILLIYSFGALVIYGTPSNFSQALKTRVLRTLEKQHLSSSSELAAFQLRKVTVEKRIDELRNRNV